MENVTPAIDHRLACALEESEMFYWSKYYDSRAPVKAFSSIIGGAFAGAIPTHDILALNRVIGLGMRMKISPAHIDDIINFYRQAGSQRFFIQLSPYTLQDDIREMLGEKGFRHHNNWVKLLRFGSKDLPAVDTDLKVLEIDSTKAYQFGSIIYNSFDWEDENMRDWLAFTVGKPRYRHFLAMKNDTPIAAAALHTMGNYASMAFAGTLAEYRNMGAQSLLLKTRIEAASEMGCNYFISETAEQKPGKPVSSFRNMCRFGFETAYLRENWLLEL